MLSIGLKRIIIIVIISLSLSGNIILALNYYFSHASLLGEFSCINSHNNKIINLSQLFINKILRSQGQITIEDRLLLENAVFATQDYETIKTWKNFLASKTEQEAQQNVLDLLKLFSTKIIY